MRQPSTRSEVAIAIFTGILTIFAIVQGVAMIAQNNLMREQMDQTSRTLTLMAANQRPWFTPNKPTVKFVENSPITCDVTFKNSSQSQARMMVAGAATFVWPRNQAQWHLIEMRDSNTRISTANDEIIGPGQELSIAQTKAAEGTTLKRISDDKAAVYVVAEISYLDDIGGWTELRVVWEYDPISKRSHIWNDYNWSGERYHQDNK